MSDLESIYNASAFDGSVSSDFLKLGQVPESLKADFVDFSVDGFYSYKTSLLNYIKAVYPTDYNNFAESDLGVMLTELFAYLGSVISFKADMLANELYLPTVQSPNNLRKLLQLIGISLKGPISSKATSLMTANVDYPASGTTTFRVPFNNRTFSVPSSKDGGNVFFTIYPVSLTTGEVDYTSADILQTSALSVDGSGVVFNNLLLLEGELKSQTGTFSDRDTIKTIKVDDTSIVEGSLIVSSFQDGIYKEVQNLFIAADGSAQVFEKVYDADYGATLMFGDNARGKSPTSADNYKVMYRTGGGDRGNIPSRALNVAIGATHSVGGSVDVTIVNLTHTTGGAVSETVEHAKRWSPYFFKTQYRAVTGEDYTTFANQFMSTAGLTGKSIAVLRNSGAGANMIDIYVVSKASDRQVERASIVYKKELLDYLTKYKMITDEVTIVDGLVRTIDLVVTVFIDVQFRIFEENIRARASNDILTFFNIDNREYGERVRLGNLTRTLFSIPEVRYASIDNFTEDVKLNFNELVQLNNLELNIEYV